MSSNKGDSSRSIVEKGSRVDDVLLHLVEGRIYKTEIMSRLVSFVARHRKSMSSNKGCGLPACRDV